jgi:hypothetical protein
MRCYLDALNAVWSCFYTTEQTYIFWTRFCTPLEKLRKRNVLLFRYTLTVSLKHHGNWHVNKELTQIKCNILCLTRATVQSSL